MVNEVKIELTFAEKKALKAIERLTDTIERTSKKSEKKLGDVDRAFNTMVSSFTLGSLAANAIENSFRLMATAGQEVVDTYIAVETAAVGVAKTTNLSAREVDGLVESFDQLSSVTPTSTEALLKLAAVGGQLGVRGVSNLEKFAKVVAQLNVATNLAGEEGAASLVRILNIAGESVSNIDRLASSIVDLGNNVNATESDIVSIANEVAKTTIQFKIGSANIVGISAALKELGIQARIGGTIVGKTFREIDKAIKKGGRTFKELEKITGLFGDDLRKTFDEDATKVFTRFIEGLTRIEEQSKGSSAALARFGLSSDGVNKVLPPLIERSGKLADILRRSKRANEENTAATKEAERAYDTLGSQVSITGNIISNIARDAFTPIGKTLKVATKGVNSFLSVFSGNNFERPIFTVKRLTTEIKRLEKSMETIRSQPSFIQAIAQDTDEIQANIDSAVRALNKLTEAQGGPILIKFGVPSDDPIRNSLQQILGAGFIEEVTGKKGIEIPLRIQEDDASVARAQLRAVELTDTEKKLNADIRAIREEAALLDEETQIKEFEAEGTATEAELLALGDIEVAKINIVRSAALEKASLIDNQAKRDLTVQKINADSTLKVEKLRAQQSIKIKKDEQAQDLKDQQAFFAAATSLSVSENRGLAAIGKAAAITQIAIKTPPAIASSFEFGTKFGGPALGFLLAGIAATAMAAQAARIAGVQGLADGGFVQGPPNPLGRDNTLINAASGELVLNRAQQDNVAAQLPSNELLASINSGIQALLEKDTSFNIDGREIARTVQEQQREGFDFSA